MTTSRVTGPEHHSWKGDAVLPSTGRHRARVLYPDIGPCTACGNPKSERHHVNGNTADNSPENIAVLCRRCHMTVDGRMEAAKARKKPGLRQSRHVKSRRALGLCGREGCPIKSGEAFRCPKHAEEHAARAKARYWSKREQKARQAA